jgi:hypothetical protein
MHNYNFYGFCLDSKHNNSLPTLDTEIFNIQLHASIWDLDVGVPVFTINFRNYRIQAFFVQTFLTKKCLGLCCNGTLLPLPNPHSRGQDFLRPNLHLLCLFFSFIRPLTSHSLASPSSPIPVFSLRDCKLECWN